MNQELVKTKSIFNALKYKDVQHQSQPEMATLVFSKKTFSKHTQHMFDSNIKPQKCFPCNVEGHNLNKCNNNQCLLTENEAKKNTTIFIQGSAQVLKQAYFKSRQDLRSITFSGRR